MRVLRTLRRAWRRHRIRGGHFPTTVTPTSRGLLTQMVTLPPRPIREVLAGPTSAYDTPADRWWE